MGLERQIQIADETPVTWPAIHSRLMDAGETPALRMIDGELAFPDDDPPTEWQELRISLSGGMVTIRRTREGIATVVWGNADAGLMRSWNVLTWAIACESGGMINHENAQLTASDYASQMKLFPV